MPFIRTVCVNPGIQNSNISGEYMRDKKEMRLFWSFLKGSKRYFTVGILAALLRSLCEAVIPQIIRATIDYGIGTEESALPDFVTAYIEGLGGRTFLRSHLYLVALTVIAIAGLAAAALWLCNYLAVKGGETMVKKLQDRLYAHIARLPFSWHADHATGDIIQRCTSDVRVIKNFCEEQLYDFVRIAIMIVLTLAFMMTMNGKLTLVAFIFVPIIVGYSSAFHIRISRQFEECDINEGILSTITQENLTGVRVVKAFGREAEEEQKFRKQNNLYTDLWVRLCLTLSLFWGTGDIMSGLQMLAVVVYGAYLTVNGQMTVGSYVAFISYNNMLIWPIRALGRMISEMSKAGVSIHRVSEIILAEPEVLKGEEVPEETFRGDIVFDHVNFGFGKTEVLKDINMTVPGGSTVGIIGSTGCGKSTLMHLLDGLYTLPESGGRITIGGRDIREMPAEELRSHIGMVLQEPFLFSRTVGENIGITGAGGNEDITRAADIACLTETIREFPQGYDTIVGERGVTLSGGQKQRVAIARMLTQKAPIMVFDDSLSAVDAETDARIRAALKTALGDATVFLISHRMSTIMDADRIFVMHDGRIVEAGSHETLLKKNGVYARLYALQSLPDEEIAAREEVG